MDEELWIVNLSFLVSDGQTEYRVMAIPFGDEWGWSVSLWRVRGVVVEFEKSKPVDFEPSSKAPRLMVALEYVDRYRNGDF